MATVVRMPAPLAQVTEAAIHTWLVEPGQTVAVGDLLAEIETEKAVVEFAAEAAGTVARRLVDEGRNVLVGEPILVLAGTDETEAEIDHAIAAAGGKAETAPEPAAAPVSAAAVSPAPAPPTPEPSASVSAAERRFISPLVRRLARERGLDLSRLIGTGPGGRIVRRDLEALPAAPAPCTSSANGSETVGPAFVDIPLTGMRRAIARRLTESKTTVPHFYMTAHVDVGALLELRRQVNAVAERKTSVNDFVLKAVAGALVQVPAANAIWNGDSIRRFRGVDLAVAVAVDSGLLTPVVRGVDRLSIVELSARVAELAERARAGRLQQHELEGGSFSVSNLGMYGVDDFAAILNPPQSGILAVSAAKPRPIVQQDGTLGVATMMTVTLSADHRVIDGAVGAEWLRALVALLEQPIALLIGVSGPAA